MNDNAETAGNDKNVFVMLYSLSAPGVQQKLRVLFLELS